MAQSNNTNFNERKQKSFNPNINDYQQNIQEKIGNSFNNFEHNKNLYNKITNDFNKLNFYNNAKKEFKLNLNQYSNSLDSVLKKIYYLFDRRSNYINNLLQKDLEDYRKEFLIDELERIEFENDQLHHCQNAAFDIIRKNEEKFNYISSELKHAQYKFDETIKSEISKNEISNLELDKNYRQLFNFLTTISQNLSTIDVQIINKQFKIDELLLDQKNSINFSPDKNNSTNLHNLQNELNTLFNQKNVLIFQLEEIKKSLFENSFKINDQINYLEQLICEHEDKLKFYSNELLHSYDDLIEYKSNIINNKIDIHIFDSFHAIYRYIDVRNIEIDNIIDNIRVTMDENSDPLYSTYFVNDEASSNLYDEKESLELQLYALDLIKDELVFKIDNLTNSIQNKIDDIQDLLKNSNGKI